MQTQMHSRHWIWSLCQTCNECTLMQMRRKRRKIWDMTKLCELLRTLFPCTYTIGCSRHVRKRLFSLTSGLYQEEDLGFWTKRTGHSAKYEPDFATQVASTNGDEMELRSRLESPEFTEKTVKSRSIFVMFFRCTELFRAELLSLKDYCTVVLYVL